MIRAAMRNEGYLPSHIPQVGLAWSVEHSRFHQGLGQMNASNTMGLPLTYDSSNLQVKDISSFRFLQASRKHMH